MVQKRNKADNFFHKIAEPAAAQHESELRAKKRRRKDQSSESFEDRGSKKKKKSGEEINRGKQEKDERRLLDHTRCIILGTGNPEVCHIVPFSVNSKEDQQRKFKGYLGPAIFCIFTETLQWVDEPPEISPDNNSPEDSVKDDEIEVDEEDDEIEVDEEDDEMEIEVIGNESPSTLFAIFCRKIFASKAGISDKSWNEICLNRQLHDWWGQGFFALKPLGIDGKFQSKATNKKGHVTTYTRVKVQFHWMPRYTNLAHTISEGITPRALSSLVGKTFGDLDLTDDSNPVFALDRKVSVSHLVETGDIFYLKVELRYADRMLAALQIQWAAIKILAMAGGAESLDDVGDHPDYLDENLNWLGHRGVTIPELIKEWED